MLLDRDVKLDETVKVPSEYGRGGRPVSVVADLTPRGYDTNSIRLELNLTAEPVYFRSTGKVPRYSIGYRQANLRLVLQNGEVDAPDIVNPTIEYETTIGRDHEFGVELKPKIGVKGGENEIGVEVEAGGASSKWITRKGRIAKGSDDSPKVTQCLRSSAGQISWTISVSPIAALNASLHFSQEFNATCRWKGRKSAILRVYACKKVNRDADGGLNFAEDIIAGLVHWLHDHDPINTLDPYHFCVKLEAA